MKLGRLLLAVSGVGVAVAMVRRRRKRLSAVDPGPPPGEWVPSGPGEPRPEYLPRLRTAAWRMLGCGVIAFVVFTGSVVGLTLLSQSAQRLLDTGTRTTGAVLDEASPAKGAWTIDVRYAAGGTEHTADITLDTNRALQPGQLVTVVYDPTDPSRVRTVDDTNESQGLLGLCIVSMIVALLLIPATVVAAVGWAKRFRTARLTGWHRASATVTRLGRGAALASVTYPGGWTLTLKAATRLKAKQPRPVWVGGAGRSMTLIFPVEGGKPRVVAARGERPMR